MRYVLEQRGSDVRNVRAVTHDARRALSPLRARRLLAVLPEFTETRDFRTLALVFKRVRNIARTCRTRSSSGCSPEAGSIVAGLTEPAERALAQEILAPPRHVDLRRRCRHRVPRGTRRGREMRPGVATFFDDVLVMADDPKVRQARLFLMKALERQILRLADVSEIVPQES